jgi:hypothetical protein
MIYYSIGVALNEAHFLNILIGIGSAANDVICLIGSNYLLEDILQFVVLAVRWDVLENGGARKCMQHLVGKPSLIGLFLPSIA